MKSQEIIQALECCATNPRKCGDCPLRSNLNCMNVSRQEAMQALKSSTEDREARWKGAGMGYYYCSLCQNMIGRRTKFCPECGAKMDEWEETEP